jgi:hypothetical protein
MPDGAHGDVPEDAPATPAAPAVGRGCRPAAGWVAVGVAGAMDGVKVGVAVTGRAGLAHARP